MIIITCQKDITIIIVNMGVSFRKFPQTKNKKGFCLDLSVS